MPSEEQPTEQADALSKMRDEFQKQFNDLKSSFESELNALKTQNESLSKENTDLQRALVRSATAPAPTEPEPKTEEQLYDEEIARLAELTLKRMKQ